MDRETSLLVALVVAGALTLAIRLSFIMALGKAVVPEWFRDALTFVPVAVFAAIIFPELVSLRQGALVLASWPRLAAMTLAVTVAWRTKNVLLTIGAGLAALWGLQYLMGSNA